MSDIRKVLLTPIGAYMQDEDGQGWTLLTKDEAEAALVDESMHHLTNEEAEQYFPHEINVANLRIAVESICEALAELRESVAETIQEAWKQLQMAAVGAEEAQPKKPPRPDYRARPKCCTRAKTKRHRKQRSRER